MSHEAKGPDSQGPPPPLAPPRGPFAALMASGMVGTESNEPPAVAETHISVVFFVGDHVYKVKKPLDLGFLDFRTREVREAVCKREVELNSRLAPDVYLGVVDLVGPDGAPFDHLVVMRRMPSERRLSTLVTSGQDVRAELHSIAQTLVEFHAHADTSKEIAEAGTIDAIRTNWENNSDQLRSLVGSLNDRRAELDSDIVDSIASLAQRYIAGRSGLFNRRIAEGKVRDCHGDVLADDIFCLADGPRILDCIEFDDRLRYGDVLGDVAFLAMDLERLGAPTLGADLLEDYRNLAGDSYPATLADFWIAYRAQVRAKVAALRLAQGDPGASAEADRLLKMALAHLKRCQLKLVLIGGAPGTGKSTLAKELAERQGWILIRSDEIRKGLVGLSPTDRSGATGKIEEGIYDQATTQATYENMLSQARTALGDGTSVVLDASWNDAHLRALAAAVAADTSSDLIELCCEAPLDVTIKRVEMRSARNDDASDASTEVLEALRHRSPWPSATVIDTTWTLEDSMTQLMNMIDREVLGT